MRGLLAIALMLALAGPAVAQRYALAVDVPADLGDTTGLPSQVLDHAIGSYTARYTLPPHVEIAAMTRDDDELLFVPASPVELGGSTWLPNMIVRRDPDGSFALEEELALPAGVGIDALLLDINLQPIVSFDVPVELDGTMWLPADLVLIGGAGATSWFDSAPWVPAYANLVAASFDEHFQLVVAFDVPTRLADFDALPGQLVRFDGAGFTSAPSVDDWPDGVRLHALDVTRLDSASGSVPASLTVTRLASTEIRLDWSPSCSAGDADYEVYAGRLGDFTSHKPRVCTTGGALSWTLPPEAGAVYYLVVPTNAFTEGSHGLRSDGTERPRGNLICVEQEVGACGG